MKKLTLLVVLLLGYTITFSQVFRERQRNSYIGFRGGYSLAGMSGLVYDYPDIVLKNISGFHAGIFINLRVADNITIEPGAYFSTKGWEIGGTLDDGAGTVLTGTLINSVQYIDAPLLFRIYLHGLNFGLGPQFSLPIKSTLDFEGTVNGVPGSDSYENTNEINDFDIAVSLSFGYEFSFGLSLQATYDLGVTEAHVLYPYPADFPYWTEGKNRVLKLSIGYVLY
jgi:hypothetical protein